MMEFRPSLSRKIAGWSLLVLGVIGFVLPVLQGALFTALGLFVLRHQYLWAHRGLGWAGDRWPNAVAKVEEMETRLIAWGGRKRDGLRRLFRRG
ncbi:PGPGW domain-containing protein [Falsiroseomonas stagni]|uniref:Putative transmembrane protein (PGPGW) n=1 Tax=Falsiroseomonas stagni DSM 19981 TaxID=1123062 RepID=A0A1I3Y7U2_9PROT|nr:PGPGW domain-containing protein [Falsiroseomonas stagni]SFK27780.1 Putative transmembrane protein (PGPGW) [Falsiroseomonas stagni DSM 19981]